MKRRSSAVIGTLAVTLSLGLTACDTDTFAFPWKNNDKQTVNAEDGSPRVLFPSTASPTPTANTDVEEWKRTRTWVRNNLPPELEGSAVMSVKEAEDMDLRGLFSRVTVRANMMWSKLGAEHQVPITSPRSAVTACLKQENIIAVACENKVEYREDMLTEMRKTSGSLAMVIIAAHEEGHHMLNSQKADFPRVSVEVSEQRAGCAAGAFVATLPDVSPRLAGEAFLRTPARGDRKAYVAFQRGFDSMRAKKNPLELCTSMVVTDADLPR